MGDEERRKSRFLVSVCDEERCVGVLFHCDVLGFCTSHIYSLSYLLAFLKIRGFEVTIEVIE